MTNPWLDTDLSAKQKALITLQQAKHTVLASADAHATLRQDLKAFAKTLDVIRTGFYANDALWRANRALTVVHLPTFLEILRALDSVSGDARTALETDLRACMLAMSAVEGRIAAANAEHLALTMDVLRTQLDVPEAAPALPAPEAPVTETGWFGGLARKSQSLARKVTDTATDGMGNVATLATQVVKATTDKMGKGSALVTTLTANMAKEGIDFIEAPISTRLYAVRKMLENTSATMLIVGGVTAILFPPAVPLITGLALMEAPDEYARALNDAQNVRRGDAQNRSAERSKILNDAVRLLTNGPRIVRMETPHVIATIDTVNAKSDVLILSGTHTGEQFSSLSPTARVALIDHAPDTQTRDILAAWHRGHLPTIA